MSQPTLDRLRTALDSSDLSILEELLAEDAHWYGSRGGGCHGRDEVLAMLRHGLAEGLRPLQTQVRSAGNGIVLEAQLQAGDTTSSWNVAFAVDPAGRITGMRDYESAATAEHDLAVLAQPSPVPPATVTRLVPFVHVADVARSVACYELLGLRVRSTFEPDGELVWAMLDNEQAAIMLTRAEEAVDPRSQGVLFYLYSQDLPALRNRLLANGVWPGEILDGSPGPRQEMRVIDPDGYCLMIAQIDDQPS